MAAKSADRSRFRPRCGAHQTVWRSNCAQNRSSCHLARHPTPDAAPAGWVAVPDLVPAHLRHFVAAAIGLQLAGQLKFDHFAGISPRQGVSSSALWSSSICMPTHTPISGLCWRRVHDSAIHATFMQLAHAVAHGTLARQHHALGGHDLVAGWGPHHFDPCRPPRA
jgi:hypothetical protein